MTDQTITIEEYFDLPAEKRPRVAYKGELVLQVYKDYVDNDGEQRYVVRLRTIGYGSKRGNLPLQVSA